MLDKWYWQLQIVIRQPNVIILLSLQSAILAVQCWEWSMYNIGLSLVNQNVDIFACSWQVVVITRCRVPYGKIFTKFLIFCKLFHERLGEWNKLKNMWNEENICQYCTRQRTITALSLNDCWNKCGTRCLTC